MVISLKIKARGFGEDYLVGAVVYLLLIVSFFFLNFLLTPSAFAEETKTIPVDQLGISVGKQMSASSFIVTATPDGMYLRSSLQALDALVVSSGVLVNSISKDEKKGSFMIIPEKLNETFLPKTGALSLSENIITLDKYPVKEEISSSGDGILQDFIIAKKPVGNSSLTLSVRLFGATAEPSGPGVRITITENNRFLTYGKLSTIDAKGKLLPSKFLVSDNTHFSIQVDDNDATYPIRIDPTISDSDWSGGFGMPGANGPIFATVYSTTTDTLYIGGNFTIVGEALANHIAKWNGSVWSALGTGTDADVLALVYDPVSSSLYVGGNFITAGGVTVNHLAKWDGSAWSALGTGVNNLVSALSYDPRSSSLYAGGYFTTAGGISANYVAMWNGSAWNALGIGVNSFVNALTYDPVSFSLYAGGFLLLLEVFQRTTLPNGTALHGALLVLGWIILYIASLMTQNLPLFMPEVILPLPEAFRRTTSLCGMALLGMPSVRGLVLV